MSPQPLRNHRPDAHISFAPTCHSRQPQLAALVMEVIAEWSYVESELAGVLAGLLESNVSMTAAMLTGIQSSEASRAAVRAAVAYARPDDIELFDDAMRAIKPIRARRNEYAHGLWADSPDIPDALILIESGDALMDFTRIRDGVVPELTRNDIGRSSAQVYFEQDFIADLKRTRHAMKVVVLLSGCLSSDYPKRDEARTQLQMLLGTA